MIPNLAFVFVAARVGPRAINRRLGHRHQDGRGPTLPVAVLLSPYELVQAISDLPVPAADLC